MRKLLASVAGLAVVCGMVALAQETTPPAGATPATPTERAERRAELQRQRMTQAVLGEMDVSHAQHMDGVLHVLIMQEERNPGIKPMVEKALASRKVVLQAEMDRLPKFQAFIKATHEGNREAIAAGQAGVGDSQPSGRDRFQGIRCGSRSNPERTQGATRRRTAGRRRGGTGRSCDREVTWYSALVSSTLRRLVPRNEAPCFADSRRHGPSQGSSLPPSIIPLRD